MKPLIEKAIVSGVPESTIILLLLLPFIAFIIAFSRNVVGIRGFGIFLPAALAVSFVATGPVIGIGLFLIIVAVSTLIRLLFRKLKLKLQYLPRMALILWGVAVGVLVGILVLPFNVPIFAVLILILLSEDFTRVQLGKSVKTALNLTLETLLLSIISYFFLTFRPLQEFVLTRPEIALIIIAIADLALAKYSGLRLMEIYRFRKLIKSK